MKLGISTACLYPVETEQAFARCAKLGFGTIEIFFNAVSELSGKVLKALIALQERYDTDVVAIHPYSSFMEPHMLFSGYRRRMDDTLPLYEKYGETAARLGAPLVVLHGDRASSKASQEEYFERFALVRQAVRRGGAELAQENVVHYRSQDPAVIAAMRRYFDDDVAFVLDIKQAVRAGHTPEAMLTAMGSCVRHLHLSDHTQEKTCLLPGKGLFDYAKFKKLLEQVAFHGTGVVELYRGDFGQETDLVRSVEYLKTIFGGNLSTAGNGDAYERNV